MNRPEKRNAISPTLAAEMLNVIEDLAIDDRRGVRVLTGAHMLPEERGPSSASVHNSRGRFSLIVTYSQGHGVLALDALIAVGP